MSVLISHDLLATILGVSTKVFRCRKDGECVRSLSRKEQVTLFCLSPLPNGTPRWGDLACQYLIKVGPNGDGCWVGCMHWWRRKPPSSLSLGRREMRRGNWPDGHTWHTDLGCHCGRSNRHGLRVAGSGPCRPVSVHRSRTHPSGRTEEST